jgi:spore maturation protein CgeB
MKQPLKLRFFAHSWISDWNHGNAHFLRGLVNELMKLGHEVRCYEPVDSWSRWNLEQEGEALAGAAIARFRKAFPALDVRFYRQDSNFEQFAKGELRQSDVVVIHEWNDPQVVNSLLALKQEIGYLTLFHDTHHRAYTSPREILQMDLVRFDGVLCFGESIRQIYRKGFGVQRAWTFHEAADTEHFHPLPVAKNTDVLWIGNWGDEERTRELEEFLLRPAAALQRRVAVHGVRYPAEAQRKLAEAGIEYRRYLPNLEAPRVYAESALTLHIPRRYYANGLSGIPTIRVFEALACGIPLLCAPWADREGLFTEGLDYLCLPDGRAMEAEIRRLLSDDKARLQMAEQGLKTIRERHTCAHRAREFLAICEEMGR